MKENPSTVQDVKIMSDKFFFDCEFGFKDEAEEINQKIPKGSRNCEMSVYFMASFCRTFYIQK